MTKYSNIQNEIIKWSREYIRPWKLFSLFIGLFFLVYGAFNFNIMDWDVPISFIMAFLTYLTAPWSLRVIVERKWKHFPVMLFATWFSVDGCYLLYWHYRDPFVLETMRSASNFFASFIFYCICGLIWFYQGTLREFTKDAKAVFSQYL